MSDARKAVCSCGQLHLTAAGDPVRVSVCHCTACQRRTGSAFGAQARYPEDRIQIVGRSTRYTRTADSGGRIDFYFCPECGATVFYRMRSAPEVVAVPWGAFADPDLPGPTVSVYEARQVPWVTLSEPLEHWD